VCECFLRLGLGLFSLAGMKTVHQSIKNKRHPMVAVFFSYRRTADH